MTPAQAKRYSRKRIDALLKTARTKLSDAHRRYKADFDKAVWVTASFIE